MKDESTTQIDATRRQFLGATAAVTAFSIVPRHVLANSGQQAPSDKLNIGCVGVGGMQGANDVRNVNRENIYALCDVDENQMGKTAPRYPNAKRYKDFRQMLDREHKNLDAITVTIPDHMHATVSLWGMERGMAVHCQKPLTQSVWESRLLTKAAKKYNVATQMEWMLLGAISWRFPNQKLLWDGKNLRFTNNEQANEYVKPRFRKGWELKDISV